MILNLAAPVTLPQAESPQVQSAPPAAVSTQTQAPSQPQPTNLTDTANLTAPQPQPSQAVLSYHVDQQSKELYFQVVDEKTGQVVRQVPSKEMLNFERRLAETLAQEQAKA